MSNAAPDVKSIFGRALEIASPSGRAAYLQEVCGGDDAVRAEVEGLLRALDRAGAFLNRPVPATAPVGQPVLVEGPGTRIGPYKMLQQIGEGGMGIVYMAEQEEPVRRKVALKIIKPGMDSAQVITRFEAERQCAPSMTGICSPFSWSGFGPTMMRQPSSSSRLRARYPMGRRPSSDAARPIPRK